MTWKIIIFILCSVGLMLLSRKSLRLPRTHGFFRFFAWEAILALFLLNVEKWFLQPLAWHQVLSWALLVLSLIPLVWGIVLLRRRGKPEELREAEPGLLAFEKTTRLVTSGIYRYIRHPLYSSLLLLAWGIFFKSPSWVGGLLAAATTGFLVLTTRADEAECVRFFGHEYVDYMKNTRRFIPFLY